MTVTTFDEKTGQMYFKSGSSSGSMQAAGEQAYKNSRLQAEKQNRSIGFGPIPRLLSTCKN